MKVHNAILDTIDASHGAQAVIDRLNDLAKQGGYVFRGYQTLPWDHRGWHGGGSSNNTHIGVEMCEPATIKYEDCPTVVIEDVRNYRLLSLLSVSYNSWRGVSTISGL